MHSGEFGQGCDVGMVSDGHGFEDSPDCERISGGVNSKGPRAVAIGRQANMLSWGFYGAPDRMTESAKRAFLNAIVWMKRFDGHVPLVEKTARARTWLLQFVEALERMPAEQRGKPDDSYAKYLRKQFPAELTADGVDVAVLRRWYDEHCEFLHQVDGGSDWRIDADLAELGIGNRSTAFLDWLLAALERDPHDAQALRLARRYLGERHGADAATARRWITENRELLFFSDTGGYRWFVDENAKRAGKPGR